MDLKTLISKLSPPCRKALEAAAQLCVTQTNFNVEVEHFLLKLLEAADTDFTRILRYYDIDTSDLSKELTRAMDKFKDSVPRGAQTWECPLHIPDVLASAKLVRAYTLGYELTGDKDLLDSARYWAWTGVPFVYLDNPTDQPIGAYASTSVFGATQWVAPVWMGQPVQ